MISVIWISLEGELGQGMSKVLRSLKNDNPIGIVIPFMSNRMDCTEEG